MNTHGQLSDKDMHIILLLVKSALLVINPKKCHKQWTRNYPLTFYAQTYTGVNYFSYYWTIIVLFYDTLFYNKNIKC